MSKLYLRPGVTPAQFYTTIGVGLGGTAAGALALTAYTWAPVVIGLIGLLVPFFQVRFGQSSPPPAAPPQDKPEDHPQA
ncbi:MAG: hypothetical protein V4662_13605 [Verrucomicrobiota bacterium]